MDMDVLDKLHTGIEALLARLDALKKENSRLNVELSILENDRKSLADANKTLLASLNRERALRLEALERIEELLCKIREYNSVG